MKLAAVASVVSLLAGASPALAETAVSSHQGVMCTSESSLGKLTMSDGNSRSFLQNPRAADVQEAERGGCIGIDPGAVVTVLTVRNNTTIVAYDPKDGKGSRTFYAPNVDFAIPGVVSTRPPEPTYQFYGELRRQCPAHDWGEHYSFAAREEPLGKALSGMSARQHSELEAIVRKDCADSISLSCATGEAIAYGAGHGFLPQLVRAFCAVEPDIP